MPFALILGGIVLLVASVRNTQTQLFTTLKGDFTGADNFIYWITAILVIGVLGYIKELKPFSTAFLVLICVAIVLKNGGFFQNFQAQISGQGSSVQTWSVPNG